MPSKRCAAGHHVYVAQCAYCNDRTEPVAEEMVTTLPELAGFRITKAHGTVSELAATSGFTASLKGNSALASALRALRESAAEMSANSIVGLSGSPFAAGGGITSAFGGDAVGVLLMGTAVTVERA